jgi:Ca-activated chloride channel family protein
MARRFAGIRALGLLAALLLGSPAWAEVAGTAVVIGLDISGSIDSAERRLELEGTAAALQDSEFMAAAGSQSVLIAVFVWSSGAGSAEIVVPWTRISGPNDAAAVARRVSAFGPSRRALAGGQTDIRLALSTSLALLEIAPPSTRQVVDIAGDGAHNAGGSTSVLRDEADRRGVLINALVVGRPGAQTERVVQYYQENVLTMGGAVFRAETYEDFARAMVEKLRAEVAEHFE